MDVVFNLDFLTFRRQDDSNQVKVETLVALSIICSVLLLTHATLQKEFHELVLLLLIFQKRFLFTLGKSSKVILFIDIFIVMNHYLSIFIPLPRSALLDKRTLFGSGCFATGQNNKMTEIPFIFKMWRNLVAVCAALVGV